MFIILSPINVFDTKVHLYTNQEYEQSLYLIKIGQVYLNLDVSIHIMNLMMYYN